MTFSFSSIFKKATLQKRGHRTAFSPLRDWEIMLITFSVVALILASWSAYLFWKINRGEIFNTNQQTNSGAAAINRKLFDETVARFETRKAQLIELDGQKIVAPDPSL